MNYRGFGRSFWQKKETLIISLCLKEEKNQNLQKEILDEKTGKIHPKNKISQKIEFIFS